MTFNFVIKMTLAQGQGMTLTFNTHISLFTHLTDCIYQLLGKRLQGFLTFTVCTFSHSKAHVTKYDLGIK